MKRYSVVARLVSFDQGDYLHANVLVAGKPESYFIFKGHLDGYLALHRADDLSLFIERVRSWIPEAGSYQVIERISNALTLSDDFNLWLKRESHKPKWDSLATALDAVAGAMQDSTK